MADEQKVTLDLTGERFDPKATGGAFIEAEHQARYQFAAPAVAGKLALDASCGVGWGIRMNRDTLYSVTVADISTGAE